jgi:homoserine dehydrogenase
MDATGAGFDEALAEATALGYAEADPTADVDAYDAAAKAAILAGLAFHSRVTMSDVHREGIGEITSADIASAKAIDCTVKLLAICERVQGDGGERVSVRTHPAMIPRSHPLAGVGDAFNAVFVEAEAAGSLMFYGRGAGGSPTASAVLGDLVAVARHRVTGSRGTGESAYAALPVQPMGEVATRYHVSLDVNDQPGVLAQVASAFAEQGVSIQTVRQEGRGDAATLVLVTHSATDAALSATVQHLARMPFVRRAAGALRVEGMSGD